MHTILFYNGMWEDTMQFHNIDFPLNFKITTDREDIIFADAVVFHIPSLNLESTLEKKEGQLWVYWSMECDIHYPFTQQKAFRDLFDVFMTYKNDADITVSYIESNLVQRLREAPIKKEENICAFISSSFNKSGRKEFFQKLMNYIPVNSYGKILRNKVIINDEGLSSKLEIMKRHKFTLAFENAIDEDYVTEKFFDPLIVGSVPVYLGSSNISLYAPGKNCFINVQDYNSVEELSMHLQTLLSDEEKYNELLLWKSHPFLLPFTQMVDYKAIHPFVRLCLKVGHILNK